MKAKHKIVLGLSMFLLWGLVLPAKITAQENQATVYIIRKSVIAPTLQYPISINNMQIGKLASKKYLECSVPAGEITISVSSDSNENIKFIAEKGKKYYVLMYLSMGSITSMGTITSALGLSTAKASFTRVGDIEGTQIIQKLKQQSFVDLGNTASLSGEYYAQENSSSKQKTATASTETSKSNNMTIAKSSSTKPSSDVDINIPVTKTPSENTFVLIIANENYEFVDDVQFALNDGETFREYCIKTLGVPERQVWLYKNASLGIISGGVDKMVQAMNIFDNAKAIIYYCGHGIPDEKTGDAYIVPVDGRGTNVTTCYSLKQLYKTMATVQTSNVTYFMDACFTGANREGSMLVAARGVAREAKKESISGNTVVFSAASGDETAMPFKEKEHGLFTYFLLKKLQETKGNVTYKELAEYISSNVKKEAFLTNEKPQNPVVATSETLVKSWENMKLK